MDRRLAQGEPLFLAGPALVEAYAVLTRLPPPHRLAQAVATTMLETNFMSLGTVVALDAAAHQSLLREAPADQIAGGRIYDAVVAACALRANVAALLTFNASHFAIYAGRGIEIVVP